MERAGVGEAAVRRRLDEAGSLEGRHVGDDAVHHADAVLNLPGASRLPAHDGVVQLVEGEGGAGSSVEGDERDLRDRVK